MRAQQAPGARCDAEACQGHGRAACGHSQYRLGLCASCALAAFPLSRQGHSRWCRCPASACMRAWRSSPHSTGQSRGSVRQGTCCDHQGSGAHAGRCQADVEGVLARQRQRGRLQQAVQLAKGNCGACTPAPRLWAPQQTKQRSGAMPPAPAAALGHNATSSCAGRRREAQPGTLHAALDKAAQAAAASRARPACERDRANQRPQEDCADVDAVAQGGVRQEGGCAGGHGCQAHQGVEGCHLRCTRWAQEQHIGLCPWAAACLGMTPPAGRGVLFAHPPPSLRGPVCCRRQPVCEMCCTAPDVHAVLAPPAHGGRSACIMTGAGEGRAIWGRSVIAMRCASAAPPRPPRPRAPAQHAA